MSATDSRLGVFTDHEFIALSGTAFARAQAYSTILIAIALFADAFGTTGFVEGLFGTAFAAAQLLIVLPLGRLVDTRNAKRFLLAGLLLNVATFVGFLFVSNAVDVVLVRILQGVGASVLWITGSSVVGEISPDDERGRWLGSYNQVGAFSSFAGDLIGGALLYTFDTSVTFVVLSAITLLAFALVYALLRDDPGGRKDPEEAGGVETFLDLLKRPMVNSLVTFRFAFSVGKMAVILFLPIYARTEFGVSAFAIGVLLAGGKLVKALLQGWMGDLTDRLGNEQYFVLAGALTYAVGTACIPLAGHAQGVLPAFSVGGFGYALDVDGAFLTMFLAYAVIGVADSIRLPASMALFVEEGERFDSVASSMSLRSISWKVGQVVGPVLVGSLKDLYGMAVAFWTAAAFIVAASAAFVLMYRFGHHLTGAEPVSAD
ncbi:MFS transporter [Halarchaeum grantii]|uniref:MFS transporter n=1 Tax=Halarchaeum grantii TaxID=1193105 RepID=UPI001663625D|nr:MFS transporter [Halarchaeum grantii]